MRSKNTFNHVVVPALLLASSIGAGYAVETTVTIREQNDAQIIPNCLARQPGQTIIDAVTQQCLTSSGISQFLHDKLREEMSVGSPAVNLKRFGETALKDANEFQYGDFGKGFTYGGLVGLLLYASMHTNTKRKRKKNNPHTQIGTTA